VLTGWEADGSASFIAFINPLVIWLWLGGIVAFSGMLIAIWPDPRPRLVTVSAPSRGLAVGRA
jgi:cytochrome c biogenesis factor